MEAGTLDVFGQPNPIARPQRQPKRTVPPPGTDEKPALLFWPRGLGPMPCKGRSVALGRELEPGEPIPQTISTESA